MTFEKWLKRLSVDLAFNGFTHNPLSPWQAFALYRKGCSLDAAYIVVCDHANGFG